MYAASIDYRVSPAFREIILARYPGLDSEHREFNWRMMQYFVYSPPRDPDHQAYLVPQRLLMQWSGKRPNAARRGWSGQEMLDHFHDKVMPIQVIAHNWRRQRCREVVPCWSDEDYRVIVGARDPGRTDGCDRVYFVSGQPVTRRREDQQRQHLGEYLRAVEQYADPNHPARELLGFLNAQPNAALKRVFLSNRDALYDELEAMPVESALAIRRRDHVARVLHGIEEYGFEMRYKGSERTTRVSAVGTNVTQLPRAFRALALRGTTAMDLAAAQLGIVAKLYDCKRLQEFLQDEADIWVELVNYLGLDARVKPIIKTTIYSLCYGMAQTRLHQQLADGYLRDRDADDDEDVLREFGEGVGVARARRFFRHPLMKDLLDARSRAKASAGSAGGVMDAFGRIIEVTKDRKVRSVLAAQAQSYEVRIMLSLLPVLERRRIHVVCWLHDGLYVTFSDAARKAACIEDMKNAVDDAARDLGIVTRLRGDP